MARNEKLSDNYFDPEKRSGPVDTPKGKPKTLKFAEPGRLLIASRRARRR